jgi:hypothetical protein
MRTHEPILIDARKAARLLGMPWYQLTRLARRGCLPHVRLPNDEPRFIAHELHAWVQAHRRPAAAGEVAQ